MRFSVPVLALFVFASSASLAANEGTIFVPPSPSHTSTLSGNSNEPPKQKLSSVVSGRWSYVADCPTGTFTGRFTFSPSGGAKFEGLFHGDTSNTDGSLTGSQTGDAVAFTVSYRDYIGSAIKETYQAALSGSDVMAGQISGGWAKGCTFTASK